MTRGKHAASAARRRALAEAEAVRTLTQEHDLEAAELRAQIDALKGELAFERTRVLGETQPVIAESVKQATASLRHELEKARADIDTIRELFLSAEVKATPEVYERLTPIFGKGWLAENRPARRARRRGMAHRIRRLP